MNTTTTLSPRTSEAFKLFMEGAEELAVVEHNGIRVDMDYLLGQERETKEKIKAIREELFCTDIWKLWRRRYPNPNIDSRTQLSTVLFSEAKLDIPEGSRITKAGVVAVDEECLQKVKHPFAAKYLELQKLNKVASTYFGGILTEQVDGFIRCFYNLHKAVSFRSSSSSINFQNIPTRHPVNGPLVRRAFIPRDGCRLIETDFSGAEVRVAGCVTKDPKLMAYLTGSGDMHFDVARDIFLLEASQVDKKSTRDWSKNRFVFPQFYGSVWFQCAPHLWEAVEASTTLVPGTNLTVKQHLAKKGVKELGSCDPKDTPKENTFAHLVLKAERAMWDDRFKVFTQWKKNVWSQYQSTGYIHMATGFTCAPQDMRRNQILNFPIQGPAFHCLLWCLIRMNRKIRKYKMKAKIVGQIHDSMLSDVPDAETQNYLELAYETMTKDIMKEWKWLIVPLEAESDVTPVDKSWADKKGWHSVNGIWQPAK